MRKVKILPITMTDDFGLDTLGMTLQVLDNNATLNDFLLALDQFATNYIADCRGCDGCCRERAPLIAADIPALAALLPPSQYPAHSVCAAFATLSVNKNGVSDICLRRDENSACCLLDKNNKCCTAHMARSFSCRSHFCLPRSDVFSLFREEVINAGENALTRLLLCEEANGAPSLTQKPLADLLDLDDYPPNPQFGKTSYDQILIYKTVSETLWKSIKKEGL